MINILRKKIFFLKSVSSIKNLPDNSLFEFCFWGRSNVGKSSLLNSIANFKLANVSKTPGRTYTLNFFEKDKSFRLVDFPGYGYFFDLGCFQKYLISQESERTSNYNYLGFQCFVLNNLNDY